MSEPAVLVVDDDSLFCRSVVDYFAGVGVHATYVTSYRAAVSQPLSSFRVVVVDNHLPDGEGLALVDSMQAVQAGPSFILVTGDPSYAHAIEALRRNVVDYLAKPIELPALDAAVRRAFPSPPPANDLGTQPGAQGLSAAVRRYAQSDVSMLLTGETGTGKSRLARAIHGASARAQGPFVSINCAALPESLIDAELFGCRRGAFTDASDRPGLLALGHGGTLFLDEIGELSTTAQAKLLAVLEEGRVRPIGGGHWRDIDVRVVAATHNDLEQAVAAGRFRADLLYRLDVGRVVLPPLREQPGQLPNAVMHLLAELRAPQACLHDGEVQRLAQHDWPGNFRQLRNVLARSLVHDPPHALRPSRHLHVRAPLPARPTRSSVSAPNLAESTLAEVEKQHVLSTLRRHNEHRARTAHALGISEATLRRKLRTWSDHAARSDQAGAPHPT